MDSKPLRSWAIPPDLHSFYPIVMRCVGYGQEYAISIASHDAIATLIFPMLNDAIENDKKPLKHYLNKNLQPDQIMSIVNSQNESLVLFENGTVKFFKSPKKLEQIGYLEAVKAICSCQYGFAMLKLSPDARKMYMELHPDSFTANDIAGRRIFDISFDEHAGLESTWRDSRYAIGELDVSSAFVAVVRNEEEQSEESKRFLFFSVDGNLYIFEPFDGQQRIDDIDHEISHVAAFNSNILRFWLTSGGDAIVLELESECLAVVHLKRDQHRLECQTVYLAMDIEASVFFNDFYAFSDGSRVEYGKLTLNEVSGKYEFSRIEIRLKGVTAMVYLEVANGILCVNANSFFYFIPLNGVQKQAVPGQFIEIDESVKRRLDGVKENLSALTELHDELGLQLACQLEMYSILKVKQNKDPQQNHFVAFLKPVMLATHNKTFTVALRSSPEHCKAPTFLTNASIFATSHSMEFQSNMWNVRCRFKVANGSVHHINVKLSKEQLIQPFDILFQSDEPILADIQIEINTIAKIGGHFIYLAFPVKTKILGNLRSSLQFLSPTSTHWNSGTIMKNTPKIVKADNQTNYALCYTMQFQKPVYTERLLGIFNFSAKARDFQDPNKWTMILFDKPIAVEYDKVSKVLRLRGNDANILYFVKMLLYASSKEDDGNSIRDAVTLNPNIVQEYCVSEDRKLI